MKMLTLVALIISVGIALVPGCAPVGVAIGTFSGLLTIIQYMRELSQRDKERKQKKRFFELAVKIRF